MAQPQKQYAAACLDDVSESRAEHLLQQSSKEFPQGWTYCQPMEQKTKVQAVQQLPFPET